MAAVQPVRVACYIDGFNLYHGIDDLKQRHLKWVNLWSLSASLTRQPRETLTAVHYFSAFATWRPGQYARHRVYVRALEGVGVSPTMAHFKSKWRTCYSCNTTWEDHEEKETDVRLALKVLEDCADGVVDRIIILSGDSDLVPVVETVRRKYPNITTLIATPPSRYGSSRALRASAHSAIGITKGRVRKHLLPDQVTDAAGRVIATRPPEYDPA